MYQVVDWMDALFGDVPLSLLEVWGRLAYILGLLLTLAAFARLSLVPGQGWALGREQQTWNTRAFFSMGLTFVLIPLLGKIGVGIVLAPGTQTLECVKDIAAFAAIMLFGYPAVVVMPVAYMLSNLIVGVPSEFVGSWARGSRATSCGRATPGCSTSASATSRTSAARAPGSTTAASWP